MREEDVLYHKLYTVDAYVIKMDVGMFIYQTIKRRHPKIIVELGSGQGFGTYWIAAAMSDIAVLYSIDHDAHFTKMAGIKCAQFGSRIRFVTCSMANDGWYNMPGCVPTKTDLLVVDGPSGTFRGRAYEYFDFKTCVADDGYRDRDDFPSDFIVIDTNGGIGYCERSD